MQEQLELFQDKDKEKAIKQTKKKIAEDLEIIYMNTGLEERWQLYSYINQLRKESE